MLTNKEIFTDEKVFLETVLKFVLAKADLSELKFSLADLREASGFKLDILNTDETGENDAKVGKIVLLGVHSVSELSEEDKLDRVYAA